MQTSRKISEKKKCKKILNFSNRDEVKQNLPSTSTFEEVEYSYSEDDQIDSVQWQDKPDFNKSNLAIGDFVVLKLEKETTKKTKKIQMKTEHYIGKIVEDDDDDDADDVNKPSVVIKYLKYLIAPAIQFIHILDMFSLTYGASPAVYYYYYYY